LGWGPKKEALHPGPKISLHGPGSIIIIIIIIIPLTLIKSSLTCSDSELTESMNPSVGLFGHVLHKACTAHHSMLVRGLQSETYRTCTSRKAVCGSEVTMTKLSKSVRDLVWTKGI
jgi:hypothetical protein